MDSLSRALQLPAQRLDAAGRAHVDQRAVLALALPLMANSAVQIVLNLTDMWFMGRISTRALAAVGAVQWLVIAVMLVLGGAGTAVQTLVAQHFGARRYRRAGQAVWTALWGIAGSAWATNAAQLVGLLYALAIFMRADYRRRYRSNLTWRPHRRMLLQQLRLGVPMGLSPAADLLGFAVFQMMQTRLGTAGGAATQMVVILTSIAYMPGVGIASAGTTLVGQSIGARSRDSALQVGDRVILLAALYMGAIGVLIALGGPWVLPFFIGSHDSESAQAVVIGTQLLWLAAGYQFFDGLNLGSSMCLRGAGDVRIPAALVLTVSLLLFVPLAHAFTFASGQGWVRFLPQFGWGAVGGGVAVLIYVMVLGSTLFLRWRSGAWQKIRL